MPKISHEHTMSRQWEMLKLLPARPPGRTADDVRDSLEEQGYPVSRRTVERDLNSLSRIFGITTHGAMPQSWYWTTHKRDEIVSVELVEAVSLVMAEQLLKDTLPHSMLDSLKHKFALARKKLSALKDHPLAQLTEKVRYVPDSIPMLPPKIKAGVLESIQQALINGYCVNVSYAAFDQNEKTLILHPLSLIQRGRTTYLVATVNDFEDPRLFAIHRMRSVKPTDETSRCPEGYSVDQYIDQGAMEFGTGKTLKLRAILSHELGIYLSETQLAEDQVIKFHNNRWQITASVRDSWQLHFWILSQGDGITILSPKSLREGIKGVLKSALEGYE